ncbi:MAG TPA: hypothetical protein VLT33_13405 [Labilithrix sp.]|nr:hypothetical protein [Labilithrix sp.]
MTSSRRARLLLGGTFTAALIAGSPAYAQRSATDIESARQLYNQGVQLRDMGDLKGALEKLKAAHALGNTPITGVELCKTHAALVQPVEAREVCLGVARIPPLAGETSRSQDARSEAQRIAEEQKAKMAMVRLRITGVPAGREATVTVDGAAVPAAALGEARAVNPGRHDLIAKIGKGAESRSSFDLAPGETKEVTLPVQAPPPEAEPVVPPGGRDRPPPPQRSNGLATAGFIVGGVGVAIGSVAGLVAISGKSDLDKKCVPDKQCGTDQHDALDSAKLWGNVSTASFIIGGAGLLVGLYATLTAPKTTGQVAAPRSVARLKPTVTPDLGPGGVGIHGSF